MLTGSRLGASFVVLVVGFIYALRRTGMTGKTRRAPMSIGILSLTMTMVAYLPGALIGWLLLTGGHLDSMNLAPPPELLSLTDTAFGWAVDFAKSALPGWALFPVGLGVLLLAFKAFDAALPQVDSDRLEHRDDAWYKKPWAMFARRLRRCASHVVGVSGADRPRPAGGQGLPEEGGHAPLHRRRQHHHAGRHAGGRHPARQRRSPPGWSWPRYSASAPGRCC